MGGVFSCAGQMDRYATSLLRRILFEGVLQPSAPGADADNSPAVILGEPHFYITHLVIRPLCAGRQSVVRVIGLGIEVSVGECVAQSRQ